MQLESLKRKKQHPNLWTWSFSQHMTLTKRRFCLLGTFLSSFSHLSLHSVHWASSFARFFHWHIIFFTKRISKEDFYWVMLIFFLHPEVLGTSREKITLSPEILLCCLQCKISETFYLCIKTWQARKGVFIKKSLSLVFLPNIE